MSDGENPFASPQTAPNSGNLTHEPPYHSVRGRARFAIRAFWVLFAAIAVMTVYSVLDYNLTLRIANGETVDRPDVEAVALRQGISTLVCFVLYIVCVVLYCRWAYRAHSNLPALSHEPLRFTPGWAIGYYFIPFANLVMPYLATKELWVRSGGDETDTAPQASPLVNLWWIFWLLANMFDVASGLLIPLTKNTSAYWLIVSILKIATNSFYLVATLLVIQLVRQITLRQMESAKRLLGAESHS